MVDGWLFGTTSDKCCCLHVDKWIPSTTFRFETPVWSLMSSKKTILDKQLSGNSVTHARKQLFVQRNRQGKSLVSYIRRTIIRRNQALSSFLRLFSNYSCFIYSFRIHFRIFYFRCKTSIPSTTNDAYAWTIWRRLGLRLKQQLTVLEYSILMLLLTAYRQRHLVRS